MKNCQIPAVWYNHEDLQAIKYAARGALTPYKLLLPK